MKQPLYRPSAYCPCVYLHPSGPVDAPTADYLTTSDWHEDTGYVEVFACTICETIFGLDRHRFFVAVPAECAS